MSKGEVEKLLDLGKGIWICKTHLDNLREQDLNARVMTKEMLEQLSRNIKKREYLESLPYCVETKKGIEIISGHHRVRAARMAGMKEIHILLDTNKLSKSEIIARQIAHNSIAGIDDQQMLKRLFDQIQDADLKLEAFIDPQVLSIEPVDTIPLTQINTGIDFKSVALLFLPSQIDQFDDVIARLDGKEEGVYVAHIDLFERFKDAVSKTKDLNNIKSVSMAVSRMCDIVEESNALTEARMEEEEKERKRIREEKDYIVEEDSGTEVSEVDIQGNPTKVRQKR
jgi:hypothetical protein